MPFKVGANGGDLKDIFISDHDVINRLTGHELWTWGMGNYGTLGDNTDGYTNRKSSPVQTIAGGTNWSAIGVGRFHMAGIKTDGTLWSWGLNAHGELGTNNTTYASSPVQTISGVTNWRFVETSYRRTAAIKTDGTLWLWGYNSSGIMGDNTEGIPKSSPVQTIAGGTNWKQISISRFASASIKTDGTLWTWGGGGGVTGVLGTNSPTLQSSPVQTVSGGTNWRQVSVAAYNMAAIKTDGTLWAWGGNFYGQLGNGTGDLAGYRSSPVQVVGNATNWKNVSAGVGGHTIAIKTDGTLWSWGLNDHGQLGDSTTIRRSSPVQTIAGGTNWRNNMHANYRFTSAIKTDGTLWLWGRQGYCLVAGTLGDNSTVFRSSPVQVVGNATGWRAVGGGYRNSAALRLFSGY